MDKSMFDMLTNLKTKSSEEKKQAAQNMMNGLGKEDSEKIKNILGDEEKLKKLLSSKEAQQILRKLQGG